MAGTRTAVDNATYLFVRHIDDERRIDAAAKATTIVPMSPREQLNIFIKVTVDNDSRQKNVYLQG
jgi:hypothetical protein